MRQQGDDEDFDDAGSVASVETGRTNLSDDAEANYDNTKSDVDDAEVDEAIEELTEKRCVFGRLLGSCVGRPTGCLTRS